MIGGLKSTTSMLQVFGDLANAVTLPRGKVDRSEVRVFTFLGSRTAPKAIAVGTVAAVMDRTL